MKKAKAKVDQMKKEALDVMVKEKREKAGKKGKEAKVPEEMNEETPAEVQVQEPAKPARGKSKQKAAEQPEKSVEPAKGKGKGRKGKVDEIEEDGKDDGAEAAGKGKKGKAAKAGKATTPAAGDYWKIEAVSNTLRGDLKDGIIQYIEKFVKTPLSTYDLEDEDVIYEEAENRKALQDNERDIGRNLLKELTNVDKFMNVLIGNTFSVKLLKEFPHADFKVGPLRVFIFSATRHLS